MKVSATEIGIIYMELKKYLPYKGTIKDIILHTEELTKKYRKDMFGGFYITSSDVMEIWKSIDNEFGMETTKWNHT